MDPLRLLSRSTKLSKNGYDSSRKNTPSSGQTSFTKVDNRCKAHPSSLSKKRKRGESDSEHAAINFFENDNHTTKSNALSRTDSADNLVLSRQSPAQSDGSEHAHRAPSGVQNLSLEEKKGILKKHKLKIAWLNPSIGKQKNERKSKTGKKVVKAKVEKETLFPNPLKSFEDLGTYRRISNRIVSNIRDEGYSNPTEVQLVALPLLLDRELSYLHSENTENVALRAFDSIDLLTVAPTGSGKTLAFLIPLAQGIATGRSEQKVKMRSISAIVLAPTKELAGQIVNEGRKLVAGTGIHISQARKGMRLTLNDEPSHDESTEAATVVKSDILVSTPGTLEVIIRLELEHDQNPLSNVRYLVLDEADVLLDPMFREQTLTVWHTLTHPDLRVSLWSATMGSNIEELAHAQIKEYRVRLSLPEAPLIRLVVGLKDSAVPNVQHKLIYAASEQGKLMSLRQILHPTSSSADAGPTLVPPFLIFTQTIERAIALHSELLYDIPAEAGGISRIAVLHSDLSDTARDRVMTRFRRAEIWVLITTDLLSRGIDFRGVNGVVNYDIPTSSAAYVHRVGRTGRAGREGGVAITLYAREDIPYLKSIANVVAAAQKLPGAVDGGHGVQPWLLDSLPSLSKKVRQELKRRGVESRTARGKEKDPKAARRARISTKAGFVRREDNRRKGAIVGAQRRQRDEKADTDGDEESGSDFGGFG